MAENSGHSERRPKGRFGYIVLSTFCGASLLVLVLLLVHFKNAPGDLKNQPSSSSPSAILTATRTQYEKPAIFAVPHEFEQFQPTHRHVAVLYSSSLRAELDPCGCTKPPSGGISRRAFMTAQLLESRKNPKNLLVVDAGDSFFDPNSRFLKSMPELLLKRAGVIREFFQRTQCYFIGVGEEDLLLGEPHLREIISRPGSLISSNVGKADWPSNDFGQKTLNGMDVLVLSLMDEQIFKKQGLDTFQIKWSDPKEVVRDILGNHTPKLCLVLLHANDLRKAQELFRPGVFPCPIVCIDAGHLLQPTSNWRIVGESLCVLPRPLGLHLSFLDVLVRNTPTQEWRDLERLLSLKELVIRYEARWKQYEAKQLALSDSECTLLRNQIARLQEQIVTENRRLGEANIFYVRSIPVEESWAEDEAIKGVIQEFKKDSERLIENLSSGPLVYKGSTSCLPCHQIQHENWKTTFHAKAFDSLIARKEEKNPNCLQCHVSGYGFPGGPKGVQEIGLLTGVQCESCHIPTGQNHPHSSSPAFRKISVTTCQGCHTPRQDPHFDFQRYLQIGTCRRKLAPGEERINVVSKDHGEQKEN